MSKSKATARASAKAAQLQRDSVYDRCVRSGQPRNLHELERPQSLCPSPALMWAFVDSGEHGHENAVAIVAAWRFAFPVVTQK